MIPVIRIEPLADDGAPGAFCDWLASVSVQIDGRWHSRGLMLKATRFDDAGQPERPRLVGGWRAVLRSFVAKAFAELAERQHQFGPGRASAPSVERSSPGLIRSGGRRRSGPSLSRPSRASHDELPGMVRGVQGLGGERARRPGISS